jgi:hypothetical protein
MPKEVVHWMVAGRAAALLSSGPFGPALARCPRGLALGAVWHDVLFYLRGDHPEGLRTLPHRLHGSHGEDPFALLRLQAAHMYARRDQPLPTAFFVGLAAHVFTDAAIHPLVYHLTGNYYDTDAKRRTGAIRRHRALECLLDMIAAGSPQAVLGQSLRALIDGLEGPVGLACPPESAAVLAGCTAAQAAKGLAEALDTFCTMQSFCRMPAVARFLRETAWLLPDKLREIAALFYAPQLWEQRAAVAGPVAFRNPVSGEARTAGLAELMEEAAQRTASFCARQAGSLLAGRGLADRGPGPSLDMGLPGVSVDQARYFADHLLPAD